MSTNYLYLYILTNSCTYTLTNYIYSSGWVGLYGLRDPQPITQPKSLGLYINKTMNSFFTIPVAFYGLG